MYTAAEIQMIRNIDPGAVLPGIDTKTGNPLAASSLIDVTKITQNTSATPHVPSRNAVYVTQAGAVLSGINFGTATVLVGADKVTIKDSSFSGTTGYYAVEQTGAYSGLTVENSTFTGTKSPTESNVWIASVQGSMTIEDNSFINSPTDAIDMHSGVVTDKFDLRRGILAGGACRCDLADGFDRADHHHRQFHRRDAERRLARQRQQRPSADQRTGQSQRRDRLRQLPARRRLHRRGRKRDHQVHSQQCVDHRQLHRVRNLRRFLSRHARGQRDWEHDRRLHQSDFFRFSAQAAYTTAGLPTPTVVSATTSNIWAIASGSKPTTIFGNGIVGEDLQAGAGETNFVGGSGTQHLYGGQGVNIVTELAMSDGGDMVAGFNPAKDVIDLSHIDAKMTTAGVQNFTFIGTAAFTGAGVQLRYQFDTMKNVTTVQVALAGDTSADLTITLIVLLPLTAANFALTAA